MTVPTLLPQPDPRTGRDRLEILTALISAPSFDPLFRPDIIKVPPNHPVYRWNCLCADCERSTMGHGDLCSSHEMLWRDHRARGGTRAEFLRTAPSVGLGDGVEQRSCGICPERPARHLTLELCHYHEFRWYNHRGRRDGDTDFDAWLLDQHPLPGFGSCRVQVCPELADSPLGLCFRHERRYRRHGRPGGATLPSQWGTRYGRRGLVAPVSYEDKHAFERWCASAVAVLRPAQVNLRGLHPLLRAEIKWGMFAYTQKAHGRWELVTWQGLANFAREHGLRSLTDAGPEEEQLLQKAVSREAVHIVRAVTSWLHPLYVTPAETRELGYILTEHFGRKLTGRSGRMDLTGVSQQWLRDLIWDHLVAILRSPSCPRSGGTFDDMRRAGLELSTFLELHASAGGHDPRVLTAEHMHQFVADQRQRERDGLVSLAAKGVHGKPSIVTANTRQRVFHRTRRLLRGALESGEAERLGLDRAFIAAMPAPGRSVSRGGGRGVEGRGVAAGKSTAHGLGAHICCVDGSGQSLIPPKGRTWAPRGARPVVRVAGRRGGRVNIAGAVCFQPGHRPGMFFKLHVHHGRRGEPKTFSWSDYRDFIRRVHLQLGTPVVWVWGNLSVHLQQELFDFEAEHKDWLVIFHLPPYAPELHPQEGIWSLLKRALAGFAAADFAHLTRVVKRKLKKIQYRPHLIAGCLPTTGLALDGLIDEPDIANST